MPVATAIGAGYVTQAEHHDRDSAGCEPPSGSQPVILPRLKACKLHTRLHRDRGLQTNAANHDRLREMEEVKTKKKERTDLGLGANAVGAVYPDILGHDIALLGEVKVLL